MELKVQTQEREERRKIIENIKWVTTNIKSREHCENS